MSQTVEKAKHLGRGLASLLGPITTADEQSRLPIPIATIGHNILSDKHLGDLLSELNVNDIEPNPHQVRTVWNEQGLADLAKSIKSNGVIQPIIVRRSGVIYQLIAGERRWRASKLAGVPTIPAIIRQVTDKQLLEMALIENIHRVDLNPIERANAYQKYLNALSLTQAEAAERLGEDRSAISNYLRLLDLPPEIRQMVSNGEVLMGHARAILALPTDELRRKIANRAMSGRLSVRDVERIVRIYLDDSKPPKNNHPRSAHIQVLESQMSKQLGTNVSIITRKNGKSGRITIEFHSLEEFDRILEQVGVTSTDEI
jgi:ParB family chromosome partitioning protein